MSGILAIDVGGTGLKAAIVDDAGKLVGERARVPTPHPCPPQVLLDGVAGLVAQLGDFDRIAVGFPGVVREGKVLTAPNLGTEAWAGFGLADALTRRFGGKPTRMINDADMQGLALVSGKGIEMVLTLGTGAGTSLFRDGELAPHMELAHHPIHNDLTYDEYLGRAAYDAEGKRHWNHRVLKAVGLLFTLVHYDHLYLGGGNAKHVEVEALPKNVTTASNEAGLEGAAALWRLGRWG